jgi:hypothetical protein
LNTQKKRTTFEKIQDFCWWKGAVLFGIGIVGGKKLPVVLKFFGKK